MAVYLKIKNPALISGNGLVIRQKQFKYLFACLGLICLCLLNLSADAQHKNDLADLELFNKYVEKKDPDLSQLNRIADLLPEYDYRYVSLSAGAGKELKRLIEGHHQEKVKDIFFVASDTTDLAGVFVLLQQFPNLEALHFYDDGEGKVARKYQLPAELLNFSKLKFLKISGGMNMDVSDTFEKLRKMPALRGVDLLEYEPPVPSGSVLPDQLTFVNLSTPQLLNLDIRHAVWRMVKVEQRGYADPKDETLLEKLAVLNTVEILSFQFCFVRDGAVFKKFTKLNQLKIQPTLEKGIEFVKSLSVLTHLKTLAIYGISDSTQSFSDLDKFVHLESLDLRWTSRFRSHPEELMSIGKLTGLRSLSMQSCHLSVCPDFFKSLRKLESLTLKWNIEKWNQQTSFAFPDGMYRLPELKTLVIWRTISALPSLQHLRKLETLDLSYNNLQLVPEGLTELKYLKKLLLTGNRLADAQNLAWVNLRNMETIDFSRNQIAAFPDGVQHLRQLKFLNLSGNKINSFPSLDDARYQLEVLILDGNPLRSLPENIHNYYNLKSLSAANCGLGMLPAGLGELSQLRYLNLEGNNLKTLPVGLEANLNLRDIILKNNKEMDEQSVYRVVLGSPKKQFVRANLENIGLKILPAGVPWEKLEVVLDLGNNQLKTLPVEMTRMKWFNVVLKNNPLSVDTAFANKGISSVADAKVLLEEFGYKPEGLNVSNKELAVSMSNTVGWLVADSCFVKAVAYAQKAKALDAKAYEENIDWLSIGIARFKTGDYQHAITDLQTYQSKAVYRSWWRTRMAKETEAALAESYRKLGKKRKAADSYALFAEKGLSVESTLNAALSYQELGELVLSKLYFDSAAARSGREYLKSPGFKEFYIYNHAEILLMAERPDEVLKMFETEDPKISDYNPAYKAYLQTAALLLKGGVDYSKLRNDYIGRIAKNGKVRDWNYDKFNRWIKYSGRPDKEKQRLYEFEALNN